MTVGTRQVSVSRHALIVAACAIVVVIGISVFVVGAQVAGSTAVQEVDATFGLGRDHVTVTPGIKVTASLGLPERAAEDDIAWKLTGRSGAGRITTSGRGSTVTFTAPSTGTVTLTAEVDAGRSTVTTGTVFDIVPVEQVVAVNVTTRGTVLIDGGNAVQGEALVAGAKVNAEDGEISYVVRSTTDGVQAGTIRAHGSRFTVSARVADKRVVNTIAMGRDPEGGPSRLDAEAEHLDGVRYVEVQTPDAVAMVKGTRYSISVDAIHSWLQVGNGNVALYDRWRYYDDAGDVQEGGTDSVLAVDYARSAGQWQWASGGEAAAALVDTPAAAPESSPENDVLERGDDLLDEIIDDEVRSSRPAAGSHTGDSPFLVSDEQLSGGGDGSLDVGTDGPTPGGTGDDGTTGPTFTPTPNQSTAPPGETPADGTQTSPAEEPQPPLDDPYLLESFTAGGCSPRHELWNDTAVGDRHLCWPIAKLPGFAGDRVGYHPLVWPATDGRSWGCFRNHARWSPDWCVPMTVEEMRGFVPPYEPPKGRTLTPTGPELVSIACIDRPDLDIRHTLWASDGKCHRHASPSTGVAVPIGGGVA